MPSFNLGQYIDNRGRQTIYLNFYIGNNKNPIPYNTVIKVKGSDWNNKKKRVKVRSDKDLEINRCLNKIEDIGLKILPKVKSKKDIKELMDNDLKDQPIDFFEFARKDIQRLKFNTWKTWNATINILEKSQEFIGKIDFSVFDRSFYDKFVKYCYTNLGYADSTLSTRLGNLTTILNNAEDQGIEVNKGFKNYKKPSYFSDSVYLNENELKIILDTELNSELEVIRDLFILRCYIGTRFKDSEITKDLIVTSDGLDFLKVFATKVEKESFIPIHPIVSEIGDKYNWKFKQFSNAYTNRQIKTICSIAGIDNEVTVNFKRGGVYGVKVVKKWQLISTHTARRTIATNLFLSGVEPELIITLTGHSTVKQLMVYVKVGNLQKAKMLARSDFFTK